MSERLSAEPVREAVLGEVIHGDDQPDSGWFILGVGGYLDVDNAMWCEPQDDDEPWDSAHFDLHGSLASIIAERDHLAAHLADVEARLAAVRFRVDVACDGYANLTIDDIPGDVFTEEDYISGAADAADAIRAALHPDPTQGDDRG